MRKENEPSVEEILESIKKVIARDSRLFNRLVAPQPADVLDRTDVFDAEPAAFRKVEPRP